MLSTILENSTLYIEVKPMSEFPSNKTEALTMLYLSKQDLSNVSPEELAAMYVEIHDKIAPAFK